MRKPAFRICENKDAYQLLESVKLISALVFATWIVQYLFFFLNPKFPVSSHVQKLCSPVCLGHGRTLKPGPEVIKLFSFSTQLSMKFILLINVKMPTIVGILTFISRINNRLL